MRSNYCRCYLVGHLCPPTSMSLSVTSNGAAEQYYYNSVVKDGGLVLIILVFCCRVSGNFPRFHVEKSYVGVVWCEERVCDCYLMRYSRDGEVAVSTTSTVEEGESGDLSVGNWKCSFPTYHLKVSVESFDYCPYESC